MDAQTHLADTYLRLTISPIVLTYAVIVIGGMVMLNNAASRPLEVPVTRLLEKRCCQTTASVHWGMI